MMKRHGMVLFSAFCLAELTACSSIGKVIKEKKEAKVFEQQEDFVECYEANLKRVKVAGTVKKANFQECLEYAESKSHAEEKLIVETINQLALTEEKIEAKRAIPLAAKPSLELPRLAPTATAATDNGIKLLPISFGQPFQDKKRARILQAQRSKSYQEPSVAKVYPYVEPVTHSQPQGSIAIPPIWKELAEKKKQKTSGPKLIKTSLNQKNIASTSSLSNTSENTWLSIGRGYKLKPHTDKRRVQELLKSYSKRPKSLARLTRKAAPFLPLILKEVMDRDMPTEIALLPLVESGFSTTALSHANAAGLWQFIPATGRRYGLKQTSDYDGRLNIMDATTAALDYLQDLHKRFDGDWLLALAAYNAGEGRVAKAVARQLAKGGKTDFWSLKLPTETMLYVPRLLAYRELMSKPQKYGFIRANPSPATALGSVRIDSSMDLRSVSKSARLPSRDSLMKYNPNFLTGKVNPKYESEIIVPRKYIGQVKSAVKMLSI